MQHFNDPHQSHLSSTDVSCMGGAGYLFIC